MAKWKYEIDVKDAFAKGKAGEFTPKQIAMEIVRKLERVAKRADDSELDDIILDFTSLPDDADHDDFNEIMETLYDWGDQSVAPFDTWPRHTMCWIGAA